MGMSILAVDSNKQYFTPEIKSPLVWFASYSLNKARLQREHLNREQIRKDLQSENSWINPIRE